MNTNRESLGSNKVGFVPALLVTVVSLVVNLFTTLHGPGQSLLHVVKINLAAVDIVPSSYSLAIWGVIYLALLAYFAYQARVDHIFLNLFGYNAVRPRWVTRNSVSSNQFEQVNRLLILVGAAQIVWCWLFALNQFFLAIVPIVALLIALTRIYQILGIGLVPASRRRRRFCHSAFSAYLAWTMVLTPITVAAALYSWGWQDPSGIWSIVLIIAMVLVTAVVIAQRRDVVFTLTVVWSFLMMALGHSGSTRIMITAVVGSVLLLVWLEIKKRPPQNILDTVQNLDRKTTITTFKGSNEK